MSQTLAATRITDREYAVEVDTALAALWKVESALAIPAGWAVDALYREAGMDRPGTTYRHYQSPKPQGSLSQVIQALEALAAEPPPERSWEARGVRKALDTYSAAKAALALVEEAEEEFNAEYREVRWSRAFLVLNSNGHVHSSRSCSTCFYNTPFGWLPELSGASEEEIVAAAGSDACTVCYPSAPVEVLSRPRTVLHETEVEAQQARDERAAAKAAKAAVKAAKALHLDLTPYGVTGYEARIETLAAAKAWLTDCQQWNGWMVNEGRRHPSYPAAAEQAVAEALAAKNGTTPEVEIAAAAKRAAKRR